MIHHPVATVAEVRVFVGVRFKPARLRQLGHQRLRRRLLPGRQRQVGPLRSDKCFNDRQKNYITEE